MGAGMVERMVKAKHSVVVFNRSQDKVRLAVRRGAVGAASVDELVAKLKGSRRIIWVMLPAGKITEQYLQQLIPRLRKGDIVIDGANDFYGNAQRHAPWFKKKGIHFFDVGVSGGVHGLKNGYTLMIGGPKAQFKNIEPFCKALAPKGGYALFGEVGAGHFVKSVHNIVEYVYLQGLAEGMELLRRFSQPIDLARATAVWEPASVVRSWLLELTTTALSRPDFKNISSKIDSVTIDELRQTVSGVKGYAPAFEVATKIRRQQIPKFNFGKQVIAAVRREFGGHSVKKK